MGKINLGNVFDCNVGEMVSMLVVAAKKVERETTAGKKFIFLTVTDGSGEKVSFPVWDITQYPEDFFDEGNVFDFTGIISVYKGEKQLEARTFALKNLELGEVDISDLVYTYTPPKEMMEYFKTSIQGLKEPYYQLLKASLLPRMDQFMIAPAGEYYHGAFRGALFLHTLGVVKNIVSMIDVYCNPGFREKPKLNTDLLITSAYLHDIGKLDEYEYEIFVRRKKDILEDHISMGATYISVINKETKLLSPEDEKSLRYMILSSHGEFSPYKPKSLEDHLLSQADMIDTKVNQFIENVKT